MANMCAIFLEGLSRSYNGVLALNDLSLKWDKGILGLVGPNGAGKTTLIKILSTLLRPTSGQARIFNKDVVKESLEVRKHLGVLHENPVFHPFMRVFPSLTWVGEIRGLSNRISKKHASELLEDFDLLQAKDMQTRQLSAGMRQKFGLIQAIIGTPPLIILDEPTSNLDPDARRLYESSVKKLATEDDCSFLISSHVLGELDRLCEGFVFLFNGKISKMGKRDELIAHISSFEVRIMTRDPSQLLPLLIEEGYTVDSVRGREIIVHNSKKQAVIDLPLILKERNYLDEVIITPLETKIETLYHQLSQNAKKS